MVSQQVDFTLPLLLLQPEFSSSVAEGTTTAKEDEDSPKQPEPPEFIVVGAAASLPTAMATLTEVGLGIHSWAQLSKPEQCSQPDGIAVDDKGWHPGRESGFQLVSKLLPQEKMLPDSAVTIGT